MRVQIVQQYLSLATPHVADRIPVTLKHFKMLARLGRMPVSLFTLDVIIIG